MLPKVSSSKERTCVTGGLQKNDYFNYVLGIFQQKIADFIQQQQTIHQCYGKNRWMEGRAKMIGARGGGPKVL